MSRSELDQTATALPRIPDSVLIAPPELKAGPVLRDPAPLQEMTGRQDAAMSRFEFKYLISGYVRNAILPKLLARMKPDTHGDRGVYTIHSLYFDTPALHAYHDKLDGALCRAKIRIRYYGGNGPVMLEVKERIGNHILKHRFALPPHLRPLALEGRPIPDADHRAVAVYNRLVTQRRWLPKVLISYRREAYTMSGPGDLRITFDRNVTACPTRILDHRSAPGFQLLHKQWVILEIKFDGVMPSWVNEMIRDQSLMNTTVSKYCHGIRQLLRLGRLPLAAD